MPTINPDQEELTIAVAGRKIGGWLGISVSRGVEKLPSAFHLEMTDKFPGQVGQILPDPGMPCQVYLSGELIITGFIDISEMTLTAGLHRILLAGRSNTEDLVDSQVRWQDVGAADLTIKTLGEGAKRIAAPFKIDVSLPDGDFPIPPPNHFPIEPGYTAAQLIEEMARTANALMWDNERGELVLSAVGKKRASTALVEGQNAEVIHATRRMDNRFSDYWVIGQGYLTGEPHQNFLGHAVDPGVKALGRYRVRLLHWESPDESDGAYSNKRALWEANRRFGRGNIVTVRVTGWRQGDGRLWTPNELVRVTSPSAKLDRDMIVSEVAWERSAELGTTALLTCMPPEALQPQPLIIGPVVQGTTLPAPH